VDSGVNAPPGLQSDPRYERVGPDGESLSNPVTFEVQTFVLAPDLEPLAARSDIARAQRVLPRLKELRAPRTSHVIRYFTGLENGLYFAYPGHGSMPEGYDNRVRPWYVAGREAEGLFRTRPYIDSSSKRVVVSFEQAIHRPDGSLLGVSGVDVDMTELIHTSDLPDTWAEEADVVLATPKQDGDGRMWLEVKGEAQSRQGDHQGGGMSLTDWDVPTETLRSEAPDFTGMVQAMMDETTGVARMPYRGTPSLWAYAPVGLDKASMLIIVPEDTVTRTAVEVKEQIWATSLGHISRLLVLVAVILVLVPLGAYAVRRNLGRRPANQPEKPS
jgi:sigma-B regulation protein RsbU (phosphoserine phosphatase)